MKKIKIWIIIPILVLLSACGLSPIEEKDNYTSEESVNITEESSLFIEDSNQSGSYLFETNDSKYLNNNGYTIWTTNKINTSNNFETITVEVSKNSGRIESGYGIVFCEQQLDGNPYMLAVMINANGLYTVGKIVNGIFYHLEGNWKFSSYINKGYGFKNKICVSYDSALESFLLKINDNEITNFTVSEDIKYKNSKTGFVVVISNKEEFPGKPVKIEFEIKNQAI